LIFAIDRIQHIKRSFLKKGCAECEIAFPRLAMKSTITPIQIVFYFTRFNDNTGRFLTP